MYKFDISLSKDDYLQFNIFWLKKSHYGRKQWIGFRLMPLLMFAILAIVTFPDYGFTGAYFVNLFFIGVLCGVLELLIPPFLILIYKLNINNMEKNGKPGYSPKAVMEFTDCSFKEVTCDSTAEHNYSSVEKVNVVEDKYVYIHVNNLQAYIIPMNSFESEAQYNDFIDFLKSKSIKVEVFS